MEFPASFTVCVVTWHNSNQWNTDRCLKHSFPKWKAKRPKEKICLILTFLLLVWDMDVWPGVAAAILQTCSVEHGIQGGQTRKRKWLLRHHGATVPSRDCSSVDCSCGKLLSSVEATDMWFSVMCCERDSQPIHKVMLQWIRLIWAFRRRKRVRFNKTWLCICELMQAYRHMLTLVLLQLTSTLSLHLAICPHLGHGRRKKDPCHASRSPSRQSSPGHQELNSSPHQLPDKLLPCLPQTVDVGIWVPPWPSCLSPRTGSFTLGIKCRLTEDFPEGPPKSTVRRGKAGRPSQALE